jgi:hypothetical protein
LLKTTAAVAITAIVTVSSQSEARPLTDMEKRIIMSTYGASLKDPASAQYRWAPLVTDQPVKGNELAYCFQINGRNSYGGYTGFRTIAGKVTRRNGAVVGYSYVAGSRDDAIIADATNEICRAFGYMF